MRFLVCVSLILCVMLGGCFADEAALKARTEKLPEFSISLPDGWKTNIPEGMECTKGRCIAGFSLAATGTPALTVSVVPSLGKTLQEYADETAKNFATHEAVMRVSAQDENSIEYIGTIKGSEARLIAVLDKDAQQMGILLLSGENEQLHQIISSLEMGNPKLRLLVSKAKRESK